MAYKLRNLSTNGENAGVTFSNVTIGGTVGDYIEFSGSGLSGNSDGGYRLAGISTSYNQIFALDPSQCIFRCNNVTASFTTGYTIPPINTDFIIRVERVSSGVWEAFLDGVSLGTQAVAANFTTNQWLRLDLITANSCFVDVYYFETSVGGTIRRWDPNLSSGTGSTLPTNDGVNQGTLSAAFPVDDSQWVFYATGPNTPINLGFANLQTNSVRFTWQQG
jgi:hypothetical protein